MGLELFSEPMIEFVSQQLESLSTLVKLEEVRIKRLNVNQTYVHLHVPFAQNRIKEMIAYLRPFFLVVHLSVEVITVSIATDEEDNAEFINVLRVRNNSVTNWASRRSIA